MTLQVEQTEQSSQSNIEQKREQKHNMLIILSKPGQRNDKNDNENDLEIQC